MKVNAVDNNSNRYNNGGCLVPMAHGAAIGAVSGYALKYAIPLTKEETTTPEYLSVKDTIKAQTGTYNVYTKRYLESIEKDHTEAGDVFIKMFDGLKEGDKISYKLKKDYLLKVKNEKSPEVLKEFRRRLKDARKVSEDSAKKCMKAYNRTTKAIRPTTFFLATGAVVGAAVALFNEVLKTDVSN